MKTVTLPSVVIWRQTERAVLMSYTAPAPYDNMGFKDRWVPKSQIQLGSLSEIKASDFCKEHHIADVEFPIWLSDQLIGQIFNRKAHYN